MTPIPTKAEFGAPQAKHGSIGQRNKGIKRKHDLEHALAAGSHERGHGGGRCADKKRIDPADNQQFVVASIFSDQRLIDVFGKNRSFDVELGREVSHGGTEHGCQHHSDQAVRQQCQTGDRVSGFIRIGKRGPYRAQIRDRVPSSPWVE